MATSRTTSTRGARRRRGAAILGAAIILVFATAAAGEDTPSPDGDVSAVVRTHEPAAIEAAFRREGYRPGSTAVLRTWTTARDLSLQIFRVGPERRATVGENEMQGVPMAPPRHVRAIRAGSSLRIPVAAWPSGLYFAKLRAEGKVGYAPFFVRPQRLGENRVAVVLPTRTWQAYNLRSSDTWYADGHDTTVVLGRPFLNRGVPFRFRAYDLHFLKWLHHTRKRVDVLAQSELEAIREPAALRRAYDLIVFPGHHEYVTEAEYDAVEGFRDLGGNLMFLSANNFFWRVDISGGVMTRVRKWRELGRAEAGLIGVQYIGNDEGEARGPWLVERTYRRSWLFRGVELGDGRRFSNGGIEIDKTSPASPRGTRVIAEIPNLLGRGMTAQMTYYRTPQGAQVFAAGAFTLAGAIRQPTVRRLLENLWARFTTERRQVRRSPATAGGDAAGYGWPVRPFHRQHPVRGFFGDPRIGITPQGVHSSFHFGIDISAPNGAPVYATIDGVTVRWPHRPETVAVRADDGHTEFQYWHITPSVPAGRRVRAYRTVLGYIEAPWAHVHFSELRDGAYVNPLRAGALVPYRDHTRPVVKSLRLEAAGAGVASDAAHGSLDLVAEAVDETPLAVPAPWHGKPVTPALLRWRLVTRRGAAASRWTTGVDFRLRIPHESTFTSVYARWTRQNKASVVGRYRFYLARDWDSRSVADGRYDVQIAASDSRGNTTSRRFPLLIDNSQ